jgi:hypothetical protein
VEEAYEEGQGSCRAVVSMTMKKVILKSKKITEK